jgi:hypothetical protein
VRYQAALLPDEKIFIAQHDHEKQAERRGDGPERL